MQMKVKVLAIIIMTFMCLMTSCTSQVTNKQTNQPMPSSSLPVNTIITTSSTSSSLGTLQSIAISPSSPPPLPVGSVQDFKANGHYSNGSTKDITSQVTWASSDESVASMYPYGGAFANSEGTTNITATLDGIISPAVILSVPSNSTFISIYLDANYSKLWDSTNQPDLSTIDWQPDTNESDSPYTWQQGVLTVYLGNTGKTTLIVDAEDNIRAVSPGFSVHSDTVTVPANGHVPLNITIEESLDVLGNNGNSSFSIWFNIR